MIPLREGTQLRLYCIRSQVPVKCCVSLVCPHLRYCEAQGYKYRVVRVQSLPLTFTIQTTDTDGAGQPNVPQDTGHGYKDGMIGMGSFQYTRPLLPDLTRRALSYRVSHLPFLYASESFNQPPRHPVPSPDPLGL